MNLLGTLLDAQGSPALKQLTSAFGVSEGDAKNALSALVPVLARGMQNNLAQQNGVEDLIGALAKGQHQRYIEQPDALLTQFLDADKDGHVVYDLMGMARKFLWPAVHVTGGR